MKKLFFLLLIIGNLFANTKNILLSERGKLSKALCWSGLIDNNYYFQIEKDKWSIKIKKLFIFYDKNNKESGYKALKNYDIKKAIEIFKYQCDKLNESGSCVTLALIYKMGCCDIKKNNEIFKKYMQKACEKDLGLCK